MVWGGWLKEEDGAAGRVPLVEPSTVPLLPEKTSTGTTGCPLAVCVGVSCENRELGGGGGFFLVLSSLQPEALLRERSSRQPHTDLGEEGEGDGWQARIHEEGEWLALEAECSECAPSQLL